MKTITTRFNPTPNGNLHIGHLYILLLNEQSAHQSKGGIFTLRFEDTQPEWIEACGDKQKEYAEEISDSVNKLGIPVDMTIYQSDPDVQHCVSQFARKHNLEVKQDYKPFFQPINTASGIELYSYTPGFTLQKVILDYMYGVTMLIRGEELGTEYSLYEYYCDLMDLPHPVHIYLPRLQGLDGNISKSHGGYKGRDMMARGWTKEQILEKLGESCLKNPHGGWFISNIKERPTWID